MSLIKWLSAPLLLVLLSFLWPEKKISLDEAITQQLIQVEIKSKGDYSGDCMLLQLTNLSRKSLSIEVPAGTYFEPVNGDEQNILMPETQLLVLDRSKEQEFTVRGYCIEPNDASPSPASAFTIKTSHNPIFDSLFIFLNDHKPLLSDTYLMQSAMWSVTDPSEISSIYSEKNEKDAQALRKYLCQLTGQKNVWYNTRKNYRLGADRRIVRDPVLVSGKIEIKLENPLTLEGSILDESGAVVFSRERKLDFPKGTVKFEFNVEVQNWEAGTYYVVYKNGDETLLKQPFTI